MSPQLSIDVDVFQFLDNCTKTDIKNLINLLEEMGHLETPKKPSPKLSRFQVDFKENFNKLLDVYYTISKEDEDILNNIFKKYL